MSPRPVGRPCPVSGHRLSPRSCQSWLLTASPCAAVTRAVVRPPVAPHSFTPVWFLHTARRHGWSPRFLACVFPEEGGCREQGPGQLACCIRDRRPTAGTRGGTTVLLVHGAQGSRAQAPPAVGTGVAFSARAPRSSVPTALLFTA